MDYTLAFILLISALGTSNRDVKCRVGHCTDEKQRTPQNAMSTSRKNQLLYWIGKDIVMYYRPPALFGEGHFLEKFLLAIENNTCVKLNNYQTSPHERSAHYCDLRHLVSRSVSRSLPRSPTRSHSRSSSRTISSDSAEAHKLTKAGLKALMSCLGKVHEHQRPDRDEYVEIVWSNIRSSHKEKFSLRPDSATQRLPYDFDSCMQFCYNDFSKTTSPTIIPRNTSIPLDVMGSSLWPSEQDYLDINLSYCGTETVITSFELVSSGCEFIDMKWNMPKYPPISMHIKIKCRLYCDDQWYSKTLSELPPTWTRKRKGALKAGSMCIVTLFVLYNPATFDHGLQRQYSTLSSRPTKAPENLKLVRVKENHLVLSWWPIPCPDQNGEILYYVIRYYHEVVYEGDVQQQESQTEGNELGFVLKDLRPNTEYSVRIAGVNSAGIGDFSLPIVAITLGGCPGLVILKTYQTTFNSITIQWIPPIDENGLPHKVKLKYSYTHRFKKEMFQQVVSCISWKVDHLRSGQVVRFSLTAVNKSGREGNSAYTTLQTKSFRA